MKTSLFHQFNIRRDVKLKVFFIIVVGLRHSRYRLQVIGLKFNVFTMTDCWTASYSVHGIH